MSTTGPGSGEPLTTVRLVDLPVALHVRASEHTDGLRREFRLIAEYLRQQGSTASVPVRLVELVRVLSATYSGFTTRQRNELEQAIAEGRPFLTLTFHVPAHAADAARALGALLDEADDYCRDGAHLLTLASPPDVVAYRRWYLGEFIDQIAGEPPVPWHPGTAG